MPPSPTMTGNVLHGMRSGIPTSSPSTTTSTETQLRTMNGKDMPLNCYPLLALPTAASCLKAITSSAGACPCRSGIRDRISQIFVLSPLVQGSKELSREAARGGLRLSLMARPVAQKIGGGDWLLERCITPLIIAGTAQA